MSERVSERVGSSGQQGVLYQLNCHSISAGFFQMLSQQHPCSRLCYIIHVCVIKHRQLAPAAAIPKQQVAGSTSDQQLPAQQRKAVELLAPNCGREAVSRGGLGVCLCGSVDQRAGDGDRSGAPAASAASAATT